MKRLIHFAFILLLSFPGIAQKKAENIWSVSLTPMFLQSREEILNGKRFSSLGIEIKPEWERKSIRYIQTANLKLGYAQPKTDLEPARVSLWVDLELQYTFKTIISKGNNGIFWAGGTVFAEYHLEFLPMWDDSHLLWASFAGIGPQIQWEKPIREKNSIYAKFEFPLFGFLSRPPSSWDYKIMDSSFGNLVKTIHSDMKLAFVNRYWNLNFQVGYKLKQSETFSLGFHYELNYVYAKSKVSNPYVMLIHGIGIQFVL